MARAVHLRDRDEVEAIRAAARVVARTLQLMRRSVRPGITTSELDRMAEEFIRGHGGRPSFKGYRGFPASICASVNDEVVHGIPSPRTLQEGDIIGIDVGVELEGYHGDAAWTFPVGEISAEASRLLQVTRDALRLGIAQAQPGARIGDISHAVQSHVEAAGNFGPPDRGPRLMVGQVLAIEPMVNVGGHEVMIRPDGWTVVTRDGSLSAHFEHTVAVDATGPVILSDPHELSG
ncbi:MAG: type I methionyl aminopeptidase [Candidatus Eisenbacteria bacterium]|uniref:Methionine aminopeptidase n=1 Tax=Eiseniibacteriota bacterium TaxID=2212470 RepID=A0A538U333_UNCEI|nr:MAG: type I methionyl aminopeptidase [Candidatus Eisenbacteria bacterium]